jgi:uncharacterized membrane protein SpoIIM required for sporulation
MKESVFIRRNQDKWQAFEAHLDGRHADPEQLQDLFVQVTDDLSYARTFYPNRAVRVYLNGLAQRVFAKLYRRERSRREQFAAFWREDLPLLVYRSRRELWLSLAVFGISVLVGIFSGREDPGFLRVILGDTYVEMTESNIAAGDPMAVYKSGGAFNSFLGITLNNLAVALGAFVMGISFGIGTVGILLHNGIMLGAFQYFFVKKQLFLASFLTIWMHGTFEIAAVILAGAAGLTLGRGLAFPGTYTRRRAFRMAARRGVGIMAGTVPLFIGAGFIEGFVTRYTDIPDMLRGGFILVCTAWVVFYFGYYPRWVARQVGDREPERFANPWPDQPAVVDFRPVKSVGRLLTDGFTLGRQHGRVLFRAALAGSVLLLSAAFLSAPYPPPAGGSDWGESLYRLHGLFHGTGLEPLVYAHVVALAAVIWAAQTVVLREASARVAAEEEVRAGRPVPWHAFVGAALAAAVFVAAGAAKPLLLPFAAWLVFPALLLWSRSMADRRAGPFAAVLQGARLILTDGSGFLALSVILALLSLGWFLLLDTGLFTFPQEVVLSNFHLSHADAHRLSWMLKLFVTGLAYLLAAGWWTVVLGLFYCSANEAAGAAHLRGQLRAIGTTRRVRGMTREGRTTSPPPR